MASLATAKRSGKTCYCIWLGGIPRRSIWLGNVTKSQANQIFSFVSQLENATNKGSFESNSVRQWLAGLGDRFHGRLVAAGLTKPRNSVFVKAFFAEQLARLKCSARTRDIYQRAHNKFFEFLDADPQLREVTPEQAHNFYHVHLVEAGMAESYRAKTARVIREFFGKAVKFELIERNPFSSFEIEDKANRDRHVFIERESIHAMMDIVSDTRWRCILGFAGLCGLRVRSEIAELRWENINWDSNTFAVPKCKTDARVLPIFGDFRAALEEYHALIIRDDPFCVPAGLMFPRCPSQTQLTSRLNRTAQKTGLQPWPKPWMNLRSSVETHLLREGFDLEAVSKWLGNSPDIARKHYLQITPNDIRKAAGIERPKKSAHSLQRPPESTGMSPTDFQNTSENTQLSTQKYTPLDSNQ